MNASGRAISGLAEVPAIKPIPYFAAYLPDSPISTLPAGFSAQLTGLILAQVVRSNDGSTPVFTFWNSAEHFAANGDVARDRLRAKLLATHGPVSQVVTPPRPWWKRINPLTAVLTLAAVAGALNALKTHYDWLLAEPLLLVRPEKSKVEAIEASDMRLSVALVNQLLRTEHENVKIEAKLVGTKDRKSQPLQLVESSIASLAGGATKDLSIEVLAPAAGDYVLRVDATAKAGWWRPAKTFVGDIQLVVWPRVPRGSIRLQEAKASWARFAGTIAVGPAAPDGLDCEMQSRGSPSLEFQNQFRSTVNTRELKWRTAGRLDSAIAVLTWSTAPVEAMRHITTEFILLSGPQTDWKAVSERLALNCYARQEKLK